MNNKKNSILFGCALFFTSSGNLLGQTTSDAFIDGSATPIFPLEYQAFDMIANVRAAPTLAGLSNPTPIYDRDERFCYVILPFEGFIDDPSTLHPYDPLDLGRRGWWRDRDDDGYEMARSGSSINTQFIPASTNSVFGTTENNGVVDAVDMLIALLEQGYDRGFRRFIINRPAGFDTILANGLYTIEGEELIPAIGDLPNAAWWSLDSQLRASLADTTDDASGGGGLAWWIAKKNENASDPITVGVYIGFQYGDCWSSIHSGDWLDADKLSHVWAMYRNIKPWQEIGVTEFVFDHVGGVTNSAIPGDGPEDRSDSFFRLRNHPAFSGLHIIGEHPVVTKLFDNTTGNPFPSGDLDETRIENNPFVIDALRLYTNSIDAGKSWNIVNQPGELNVFYDYHPTADGGQRAYTQDQILFDMERGFTPWAWGASRLSVYDPSVDLLRWIMLDQGNILLNLSDKPWFLADINADGIVDDSDGCIVYTNITEYANGNLVDFHVWDGDLDFDGDIDSNDFSIWLSTANLYPNFAGWAGGCQ